jgi:hypothetical protein
MRFPCVIVRSENFPEIREFCRASKGLCSGRSMVVVQLTFSSDCEAFAVAERITDEHTLSNIVQIAEITKCMSYSSRTRWCCRSRTDRYEDWLHLWLYIKTISSVGWCQFLDVIKMEKVRNTCIECYQIGNSRIFTSV